MSDLDPEFLELEDVFELHADSIARYGGDRGVRDRGLIDAAVAVPRQSFGGEYLHKTLFEMAAAYAFHIAESQGFVDGNKRAGLAAATAFLAASSAERRGCGRLAVVRPTRSRSATPSKRERGLT